MTPDSKRILLIGGGGHCRSVLDSVLSLGLYDEVGIVDREAVRIPGASVVGSDQDLGALFQKGWTDAFITLGSVGNTALRRRIYSAIREIGFHIPTIADKTAAIAGGVRMDDGCFIGKNAVINAGASLGCCAIINTGAIVEHDCAVGDFSHISPGAVLCGQVRIGHDTHIGAGTVVRQLISVGNNVLIGAGSVVVKDIPDGKTAYGNPCRIVER